MSEGKEISRRAARSRIVAFIFCLVVLGCECLSPFPLFAQDQSVTERPCYLPLEGVTRHPSPTILTDSGSRFTGTHLFEGDLILDGGEHILDGATFLMTPTFCPTSNCPLTGWGHELSPKQGQPNTRIIVKNGATLRLHGATITTSQCDRLWGGIIVEAGSQIFTDANQVTGSRSLISQGMWGVAFEQAGQAACRFSHTDFLNNYLVSLQVTSDDDDRVSVYDCQIGGIPSLMGIPYAPGPVNEAYLPIVGIGFAQTPWNGSGPEIKHLNVHDMIRGVSVLGDGHVGALWIRSSTFSRCYDAAIAMPQVQLTQSQIDIPPSRLSWPQMTVPTTGAFYRNDLIATQPILPNSPHASPHYGASFKRIYGILATYGAVLTGCRITSDEPTSDHVGVSVSYAIGADAQYEDNEFVSVGTGIVVSGHNSSFQPRFTGNLFEHFDRAIILNGILEGVNMHCNTFDADRRPGATAILYDEGLGQVQNSQSFRIASQSIDPSGNHFKNFENMHNRLIVRYPLVNLEYYRIQASTHDQPGFSSPRITIQQLPVMNPALYCDGYSTGATQRALPTQHHFLHIENPFRGIVDSINTPLSSPPSDQVCGLWSLDNHAVHRQSSMSNRVSFFSHVSIPITNIRQSVLTHNASCEAPSVLRKGTVLVQAAIGGQRTYHIDSIRSIIIQDANGASFSERVGGNLLIDSLGDSLLTSNPFVTQIKPSIGSTYFLQKTLTRRLYTSPLVEPLTLYDLSVSDTAGIQFRPGTTGCVNIDYPTYHDDHIKGIIVEKSFPCSANSLFYSGLFKIENLQTVITDTLCLQQDRMFVFIRNLSEDLKHHYWRHNRYVVILTKTGYLSSDSLVALTGSFGDRASRTAYTINGRRQGRQWANYRFVGPKVDLADGHFAVLNNDENHVNRFGRTQISILDSLGTLVRSINLSPVYLDRSGQNRMKWQTLIPWQGDSTMLAIGTYQYDSSAGQPAGLRPIYRILRGERLAPPLPEPPPGLVPRHPTATKAPTSSGALGAYRLYPNPTTGQITIEGLLPSQAHLELYTLTGQRLYRGPAHTGEPIPLPSTIRPGLYHWQLMPASGGRGIASGRIIVQ